MKYWIYIVVSIYSLASFAQGEANNWYFGQFAGLDFSSGTPVPFTNGQLNTIEGCATLSTAAGQLLFYTDGITVYNRNHQVMVNGSGLLGHPSSAQSATIVPKPGSSTLYYIFTTDNEHDPDGLRYSIVDMSLNGGMGAVTSNKNILIYTPTIESFAITKHANGNDFWIISHGWESNSFHAYLLTSSGLSATPVTSNVGNTISGTGFVAAGIAKISPSGRKLALSSVSDFVQLFDFNNVTGVISNARTVIEEPWELYGVEFSPNEEILYVTNVFNKVYQFDLNAADIPSSKITLYNSSRLPSALQMGPDGKIYVAVYNQNKLGVINNPNVLGLGCNFQIDAIDLGGRISQGGLPSFSQSFFFSPAIVADNACVGQSTTFELNTNQTITSATWNFGDGNTSNNLNASHVYASPGVYTVSVAAVSSIGIGTQTRDIVISAVPTATQPQDIKTCDTDNNGFYNFDLTSRNNAILNGQSPSQYSIRYFANATDYTNNIAIATPASYPNVAAYQSQTIIAEVSNNANGDCKATTSFVIQVFETPLPSTVVSSIQTCDNTSVGTDVDGRVLFNLTQRATAILNGQSVSDFSLTYYKDSALTQQITTPTSYANTNPTETIWVKMTNIQNPACFAVTSFDIEVFSLPVVNAVVTLKQCDDNQDGFSAFNLDEAITLAVTSTSGLTFSFFESSSEANSNSNPITNVPVYTNQIVNNDTVYIRVQNANGCHRVTQLNLVVSTTQIPANFPQRIVAVCDDIVSGSNTDGIATFDFSNVDGQIRALFPVGQQLDITYYKNLADALAEQNTIIDISNYTNIGYPNLQNIYVRVDSQLNNECLGLGDHITLNVESIPIVQPQVLEHCDDNQDGIYAFDTTNLQSALLNGLTNVTVSYTDQTGNPLPSPLPNPFATSSQTITVTVANNTAMACNYSSTIRFIVDDLPEAFQIPVTLTTVCDDETDPAIQNGSYPFNTTTFQSTILGSQTGMTVAYFDGNNNPLPSPLPNPFNSATQNIRVEVVNSINNNCSATMTIPLVVNPVPVIQLTGEELVCSDNLNFTKVINSGLLDESIIANFTYTWYLNSNLIVGENNYALTVNQEGVYTVDVSNANGCIRTRTITVMASDIATITNVEVTDLSNDNSIVVHVTGQGDYVYSLDNMNFQQSNVFTGLEAGIYNVYVKDLNGCGTTPPKEVSVLGIPNFFTPNGDGYNDFWNIKGVGKSYANATTIYIFNRYGKLLKQLSPHSPGWDGVYNGQSLPSDDYWFSIELQDGRIFKGHFALKR
ncbi:hypothetical protein FLJC2902T_22700 [Flavobacterium limnosediminis JC2902]|uniref:PKD domain-containing protein n=1 Tax=Flavobacterium limnosediminis JC2902 TaxID=1341181 RepID=V6SLF1_9FLAO|nr:T9SS C-terminal target domain-containing protein [Flavobacterium limnosediminis]ESU27092.1 hypothetical protein FLJC2902T_22700 [Flavobacterium limnosediminis JC2902]